MKKDELKMMELLMKTDRVIPKAVIVADVCNDTKLLFGDLFTESLQEVDITNRQMEISESVKEIMYSKIDKLTDKELLEKYLIISEPDKIREEIRGLMKSIDISACFIKGGNK